MIWLRIAPDLRSIYELVVGPPEGSSRLSARDRIDPVSKRLQLRFCLCGVYLTTSPSHPNPLEHSLRDGGRVDAVIPHHALNGPAAPCRVRVVLSISAGGVRSPSDFHVVPFEFDLKRVVVAPTGAENLQLNRRHAHLSYGCCIPNRVAVVRLLP